METTQHSARGSEVLRNRYRSRSARKIGIKIETSFHVAPYRQAARRRHSPDSSRWRARRYICPSTCLPSRKRC